MIPNHSPWIQQLKRTDPTVPINKDVEADVAIVGGGIAGITTAFFTLRNTNKSVVLIEASKIAHGATGHNAGQITSYFERPLAELVEEFGLTLATDGQRAVESGWILIDEIVAEACLQTPLYRFTGYAGLSSLDQVLLHLKNNRYRVEGGLPGESMMIASEWEYLAEIPEEYKDLYTIAPQKDLLELLETDNTDYFASLSYQKGCMNSALFTEDVLRYLVATCKDRFSFYEDSPVKIVRLTESNAVLQVLDHTIKAESVVLCTNGFENFSIINEEGPDIDTNFHHMIAGRIAYMSGYVEPLNHPPTAISYFPKVRLYDGDPTGDSYFYLTRRPLEHKGEDAYNLVCAGGPEKVLPNGASYERDEAYSEDVRTSIDEFFRNNYDKHPKEDTEYAFSWHGLMGYTPNGVRLIGPEPCNPRLLYNLGCNGVGILASIFGGMRISRFINNEKVEQSIFDPCDKRIQPE